MVTELHDMIGANSVFNDPAKREAYGRDESGLSFDPELVVESDNIKQIQQLMVWATRHRIPVTPRAAASNVTGGALAVRGGVILSLLSKKKQNDSPQSAQRTPRKKILNNLCEFCVLQ